MPIAGSLLTGGLPIAGFAAYKLEKRRRLNEILRSSAQTFVGQPEAQKGVKFGSWDARTRQFTPNPAFKNAFSGQGPEGPVDALTPDEAHLLRKNQLAGNPRIAASYVPGATPLTVSKGSAVSTAGVSYVPVAGAVGTPAYGAGYEVEYQTVAIGPDGSILGNAPAAYGQSGAPTAIAAPVPAAQSAYTAGYASYAPPSYAPAAYGAAPGSYAPTPAAYAAQATGSIAPQAAPQYAMTSTGSYVPMTAPSVPSYNAADVFAH